MKVKRIEPELIKAGDARVKLGIPGTPPKIDCRVVSEDNYQELKRIRDESMRILRDLAELQTGPPLLKYEVEYTRTMEEIWDFLEANEKPRP